MKKLIIGLCTACAMLLAIPQAQATKKPRMNYELTGKPTCKKIAVDDIIAANDRKATKGRNRVKGPDGQEFVYKLHNNRRVIESWEVVAPGDDGLLPVSFVIVKGTLKAHGRGKPGYDHADSDSDSERTGSNRRGSKKRGRSHAHYLRKAGSRYSNSGKGKKDKKKPVAGARIFHYGSDGALDGSDLLFPGKVTSVSFCYAPGEVEPPPPPPPVDLVNKGLCEELDNQELAKTRVLCPSDGERAIISMSLEDEQDFAVQFCTCGIPFDTCNPNLNMGDLPDTDGEFKGLEACTGNQGINTRVPLGIMGVENPDSYVCFTSGGRRVCYGHF